MAYLLDTNICIAFLNEADDALRRRLEETTPEDVKLCSVVKAELLYGARAGTPVDANLAKLARFFGVFESLPFDDDAAGQYGLVRAQLRRVGMPIGANDMMIAAIALSRDITIVTRDQDDFQRVAGLRAEAW